MDLFSGQWDFYEGGNHSDLFIGDALLPTKNTLAGSRFTGTLGNSDVQITWDKTNGNISIAVLLSPGDLPWYTDVSHYVGSLVSSQPTEMLAGTSTPSILELLLANYKHQAPPSGNSWIAIARYPALH